MEYLPVKSEKEQLQFAALAINFSYLEYEDPGAFSTSRPGLLYGNPNGRIFIWNPYLDSREAVSLSIILKINIKYDQTENTVSADWCQQGEEKIESCATYFDDDSALIAFRTAIVDVASEIGRRLQMKQTNPN
jgi:hypothetical protein